MAVLIGDSNTANFALTTSTYSASNGEFIYAMTAAQSGNVDTLFTNINAWNITANLRLLLRNSSGDLLASGVIASAGGTGVRSVSVTPVAVTQGQTYYIGFQPNTGSTRPYQNATTHTVAYDTASTYASPADPFNLPGNTSASTLRQFHVWAEGDITPTGPEITAVNGDDTVTDASSGNTVTTSLGLDSVSAIVIRDADLNETAGSSIAGSGTSWTFATPAIADRAAAYYGSATLVLTGVYDSGPVELEFPITFNQPSGLDLTTLAADPNTTSQAVGYGIITIAEGGQYAVDPTKAVVFTDALGYTIGDQSAQIAYVYDGTMTVFTLLTGSEASAGGFTAQGFTSQGFTAQGFTSRGFA